MFNICCWIHIKFKLYALVSLETMNYSWTQESWAWILPYNKVCLGAFLYTHIYMWTVLILCHFEITQEELQCTLTWPSSYCLLAAIIMENNYYTLPSFQRISNWFSKILSSSHSLWVFYLSQHIYWVPTMFLVMRPLVLRSTMFGRQSHMTMVDTLSEVSYVA